MRHIRLVPDDTKIPFMGMRHAMFAVSGALSVLSIVLFFVVGLNLGIDFLGGTLIEIRTKAPEADLADIRSRLGTLDLGDAQVQGFGAPDDVLIRISVQSGEEEQQAALARVRDNLSEIAEIRRVEVVGPSVSGELTRAGITAVLVALVGILIYIWFRFEWQFALGAIVATVHDVVITMGFIVITGLSFDLSSIAAILTIVGYSLNDTVVVYDRIRENLRKYKRMRLEQLIDMSINDTLGRTLMTSVTTLAALAALYLFGGEVIRSFTAAMLFGVLIGTFSSIFLAAPMLILFRLRPGQGGTREEGAAAESA